MITRSILVYVVWLFGLASCSDYSASERLMMTGSEAPADQEADTVGLPSAVFAGGCFWCTEAYFERLQGVTAVISGYAGGKQKNPTYEQVSSGLTNHAESVEVFYNPRQITYQELLEVFFATHDPTTLNRQGPDVGKQYRSIVFYKTPEEKQQAEAYIRQLEESGTYKNPIVTKVQPLEKFWPAEEYHQDYYRRHPDDPYVVSVAMPKVRKFEDNFRDKLKREYVE